MVVLKGFEGLGGLITGVVKPPVCKGDTYGAVKSLVGDVLDYTPVVGSMSDVMRQLRYDVEDALGWLTADDCFDIGADDPVPVKGGSLSGRFVLSYGGTRLGLRRVNDAGVGQFVKANMDAIEVVRIMADVSRIRGLDMIDVRIPRYLSGEYMAHYGLELYPVLMHRGGYEFIKLETRPIRAGGRKRDDDRIVCDWERDDAAGEFMRARMAERVVRERAETVVANKVSAIRSMKRAGTYEPVVVMF